MSILRLLILCSNFALSITGWAILRWDGSNYIGSNMVVTMSKNKKSKQVATSPKKSGEEAFEETKQQVLDRYKGEPENQKAADKALGKTYMDWRNDFAFKFVFGSHSENMRVLLSDLLGFQVDSVNPAENEVPGVFVEGKIMRFDFTCTSGGRKFIVEMQNSITENLEKRVIAYVSAGVLSQVKRSENYEYDPVYEIIITDFKWTGISYGPITRFQLRDEDHHPMPSNLINVHVCNIAMVKDRPFEELGNPALEALHVLGNICNFAQLPEEFPDRYRKAALMSTIRKLQPDTIMGYISSVVSEEEKLSHGRAMYQQAKEEAEEEKQKAIEESYSINYVVAFLPEKWSSRKHYKAVEMVDAFNYSKKYRLNVKSMK